MYPEYYRTDTGIAHEDERFLPFFPFLPFLGGIALGGLLASPRPYYGAPYPVPYPTPYPVPYPATYSVPYPTAYPAAIPVNTINQGMSSVPHQIGVGINDSINIFQR